MSAGLRRAARLRAADLTPELGAVAAIGAAAAGIMAHCNAIILTRWRDRRRPGDWRMVAVDVDGCDLAQASGWCAFLGRRRSAMQMGCAAN